MGQVYEAHDLLLNRRVAIKVARRHIAISIRNEARAMAALRHPALVDVHGVWKHEGMEYAVMERIYGVTLDRHVQTRAATSNPLQLDEILEILRGVADGLGVVHRAGMAHRDVKPANIMLAPNNRIVLMDFGIFRPEIERRPHEPLSGSPWYMAPEAIANKIEPGRAFLVDMYALGILAFELLTGAVPFTGDMMKVLADQLNTAVPNLAERRPDLPPRLCALVHELLAKEPQDRPQDMQSVEWRFRKASRGITPTLPPAPGRFTVLIAEDNPGSAAVMQELISQAAPGAAVRISVDGRQALELVRRDPPHLLLVDLHLPSLSGVELCMSLRGTAIANHCTIVPVSSFAESSELEQLKRMGFSRFIPKGAELAERLPALVEIMCRRLSSRGGPPST